MTISQSNQVDVLFVVDQSPQGQAWQLELADLMPQLVDALAESPIPPDVRIGIVGAQTWGDHCLEGPHLGGSWGAFSSTSCLERPERFSSAEAFERACASRCGSAQGADALWFRFAPGEEPVLASALAEQLRCAAVLGDKGCALAQPFGSTLAVFERTPESGVFFRDSATPVVVIVSGSDDCTPVNNTVFTGGSTTAECWEAAAQCVETEDNAWSCEPAPDGGTELVPVATLFDWMRAYAMWKWRLSILPTHLSLWMGWEPGTAGPGPVRASAPATSQDEELLGVGPACRKDESVATPPVRAAAVWDQVARRGTRLEVSGASLCDGGLAPAMDALAKRVLDALSPGCVHICAADGDDALPGLQHDCEFVATWWEEDSGSQEHPIALCERDGDESVVIPDGEPGCVDVRSDARLDPRCREQHFNLNVILHWQGPRPQRLSLVPSCTFSDDKATDCPGPPE